MPIYEYHCNGCNNNFEALVFGNEKPVCDSCNSKKVSKLMSTCGFVSKGSGVSSSASGSSCSGCTATSCSSCS
ncbi:MAG: zinc ribbon domain-containing protein [Deltaproteobacteria bacterium]|nr:zinc ribbon domain-containing protein [Deltaproteobacteria bacterium]